MQTPRSSSVARNEVDALQQRIATLEAENADLRLNLAATKQQYELSEAIFAHAPIGFQIFDANGVSLRMNETHRRLLGLPSLETGIGVFNALSDPFMVKDGHAALYARAYAGEVVQVPDYQANFGDPTNRWPTGQHTLYCNQILFPIFGDTNVVETVVSFTHDITARKRAELVLQADLATSQHFFEAALDALDAHIAVLNEDGTILNVNHLWQQFALQNGGGDLVGANYLAVCDHTTGADRPIAQATAAGIRQVRDGALALFTLEYPCFSPTEQRWFQMRVTRFGWGNTVRLVVAHENITERKLAEEALRVSETRLRTLIQHIPDGAVVLFDHELRYLVAEGPALTQFGYTSNTLEGYTVREALPPELADCIAPLFHATITGDTPKDMELHYAEHIYRFTAVPISNTSGSVVGGMALLLDITTLRKMEDERLTMEREIQEARRLESIGVLAGGIAHDFNNLLVAIMGNAELALLDAPPHSSQAVALHELTRAGQRAATLTAQLLAYSGRSRFALRSLDLNMLIHELAASHHLLFQQQTSVGYELAKSLPLVNADATQLRQVVLSLLANAGEALTAGGTATVATSVAELSRDALRSMVLGTNLEAGRYVCLQVRDTGQGMDEATQARMFEPFFSTRFAGRGLGLAAVHGVVRAHQGAIAVRSKPGQGTTVEIWLPVLGGTSVAETPPLSAQPRQANVLLVIDDELSVRTILQRVLEHSGYSVRLAEDGMQGLAMLQAAPDEIAAVLLDMTMPGLTGDLVAQRIRASWPAMPIILMSGYDGASLIQHQQHLGTMFYLQKPFQLLELRATIQRVLAGR